MAFYGFFQHPQLKAPEDYSKKQASRKGVFRLLFLFVFVVAIFILGIVYGSYLYPEIESFVKGLNLNIPWITLGQYEKIIIKETETRGDYVPYGTHEDAVVNTVKEASPAVVSIMISKYVPTLENYYFDPFRGVLIPQYNGGETKEIGGGSGFIISKDGYILTNKHVVSDDDAEYTVFTNDGKSYPAEVVAKDPLQDLAIIKIEGNSFPMVKLGDSSNIQIGQTAIAIGNALGEYRNTVSVGVVSGLGRDITAGDSSGMSERIEDMIQTDAAINQGNSGGPLFNLRGEVIGINTATDTSAENIGFAIPINKAKRAIQSIEKSGKIVYPFLGIRYQQITEDLKKEESLSIDYGILIGKGANGESAITPGSPAEKAGLKEGDIILEFNGIKITLENTLSSLIQEYNPSDEVALKVLSGGKEKIVKVILGERTE